MNNFIKCSALALVMAATASAAVTYREESDTKKELLRLQIEETKLNIEILKGVNCNG